MTGATASLRPVYFHSALQSLAENAGALFISAFLVRQGLSQPMALATSALIVLSRYAMRPIVLPLALRFGLTGVAALGVAVRAVAYLILPHVVRADGWLLAEIAVMGLGSVLYWTSWHAFNAAIATSGARGRQVSGQQAATAAMAVIAPMAGGQLLTLFGPATGFVLIAGVQALAIVPLLCVPNPHVAAEVGDNTDMIGFARPLYFAEGFHSGAVNMVWGLALFVSLGEHFGSYGGAMALAGLSAAGASLIAGRHVDAGRGRETVVLAYGLAAVAALAKALAYASPIGAIAATALGAVVTPLTQVALLAPLYAMARRAPCPLRFAMATEAGWDLGCAAACLGAAGALAAGADYRPPLLAALAAIAVIALMLRHWYRRGPAPA